MAPRLPPGILATGPSSILVTVPDLPLLPRIARRGVRLGWSTAPDRTKFKHMKYNEGWSDPEKTIKLPDLTTGPAAALKRRESTTPLRSGVLAYKIGMSAVHFGRDRIPCTILQLDQVQVVANKTFDKHGYWAVQIGCGTKRAQNVPAPMLGYYEAKGVAPKRHLAEFYVRNEAGMLPVGVQILPDWFRRGQYVDIKGTSKGKGFAGVMKRHGFSGQEASHGNSLNHRTMGSTGISQGGGSRVYPGKKMPGRMGGESATVQNLTVLKVDNELGIVVVSGPVAGPKGGVVKLYDSKKRKQPGPSWREHTYQKLIERFPDHETKLEEARKLHLELKRARHGLPPLESDELTEEDLDYELEPELASGSTPSPQPA